MPGAYQIVYAFSQGKRIAAVTAAVRAGAEPLYSTNDGLAEDGVGEGLQMNVLFRGTHAEIIYRHRGYVVGGKKAIAPAPQADAFFRERRR